MSMNGQESAVATVLYPLYNFLLAGLMLAVVLFSYFLAQNLASASGDAASEWDKAAATWNMCLYFFLALVGGYYCYRCYVLFTSAIQLDQQNKHRRTYLIVIVVFFVIFMLRFLWCFLYSINANPIQVFLDCHRSRRVTIA